MISRRHLQPWKSQPACSLSFISSLLQNVDIQTNVYFSFVFLSSVSFIEFKHKCGSSSLFPHFLTCKLLKTTTDFFSQWLRAMHSALLIHFLVKSTATGSSAFRVKRHSFLDTFRRKSDAKRNLIERWGASRNIMVSDPD